MSINLLVFAELATPAAPRLLDSGYRQGMHSYSNIQLALDEGIATLVVNRPAVKNALDRQTVNECHAALREVAASDAGVLIITGAGESSFVSGADINDIRRRTRDDGLAAINSSLFVEVERLPRPTIAAVNGCSCRCACASSPGAFSVRARSPPASPSSR